MDDVVKTLKEKLQKTIKAVNQDKQLPKQDNKDNVNIKPVNNEPVNNNEVIEMVKPETQSDHEKDTNESDERDNANEEVISRPQSQPVFNKGNKLIVRHDSVSEMSQAMSDFENNLKLQELFDKFDILKSEVEMSQTTSNVFNIYE